MPVSERDAGILLTQRASSLLNQLIQACGAEENIVPVSGYRTLKEQTLLFQQSLRENGEVFTRRYVALPDCSEHQTGLAIDVGLKKEEIDFIRPEFPDHGICGAFKEKAPDFGFIERYQPGKEIVTGISSEPWHFRYVGYPHSKIMDEQGAVLEEYIAFLKGCAYPKNPLIFMGHTHEIQISYIRLYENEEVCIPEPEGIWQLSGNNVDGVILTVWNKR